MPSNTIKVVVFWFVIGLAALLLWQVVKTESAQQAVPEISYSQFMADVDAGGIDKVTISGNLARARYRAEGKIFRVVVPHSQEAMLGVLRSKGVEIWFRDSDSSSSSASQLFGTWAPLILIGGLWFFMIRQMQKNARMLKQNQSPGVDGSLR